jgi:hypothetical protein
MWGKGLAAAALAATLALFAPGTCNAEEVDLLLVLAADVSRSVDTPKFQLQRDGYAAALSNPRVLEAIQSGTHKRIALCFVEWSGSRSQKVIVDWTVVRDLETGRQFGDRLIESPRPFAERTSISAAIDFSVAQFALSPFTAARRTIDVSGDGTNNSGREVRAARDEAVAQDITINGLVILSDRPMSWNPEHTHPTGGLANYYRENVIGGPGAFVMAAEDFNAFGHALINKLVAEIAQGSHPRYASAVGRPQRTTPEMQQGLGRGGVIRLLR